MAKFNRGLLQSMIAKSTLLILFIFLLNSLSILACFAQRVGNQAEMDRLEQQADDLAAQQDPEGAASAIGKAAMMADLLSKDAKEPTVEKIFHGASHLFRAEELGLRALALFERTGGQPPAPAGVCHYLVQSHNKLQQANTLLETPLAINQEMLQIRQKNFLAKNEEWKELLADLYKDFACPHTLTTQ